MVKSFPEGDAMHPIRQFLNKTVYEAKGKYVFWNREANFIFIFFRWNLGIDMNFQNGNK